jgi:hypothetical protein
MPPKNQNKPKKVAEDKVSSQPNQNCHLPVWHYS